MNHRFFARVLPALTLCAWSALLLYFYFSGRINPYVTASFRLYCLAAGLLLPVVALGLVLASRGVVVTPEEECEPSSFGNAASRANAGLRGAQWLAFLILTIPIYAAAAVTKDSFSVLTIMNRGFVEDASAIPRSAGTLPARAATKPAAAPSAAGQPTGTAQRPMPEPPLPTADGKPAEADGGLPPTERVDGTQFMRRGADGSIAAEVVDFLFAAVDDGNRKDFEGKKFEVVGQFLPDKGGSKLKFQLVRMFMFCCASDARPVALAVDAPGTLEGISEMGWVKLTGVAKFRAEADGRFTPYFQAERVTPTEPPAETMLY